MQRNIPAFHRRLHDWYAHYGRQDLPWRNIPDPYTIYISEILLQQTQVKTVLERYFYPFMDKFPTIESLAGASVEDVLKAWEGLGYYSRARNLHRAAQLCDGRMPETLEGLLALPGVGKNTAHAVLAFAYHQPVAILEANVKRVAHRIFALAEAKPQILWQKAEALLDAANPFDYNQAMMDVGAMICTPKAPQCGMCPAKDICAGKAAPELYPAPKAGKKIPVRKKRIVVLEDGAGNVYLRQREGRFLGGLYGFIEIDYPSMQCWHANQALSLHAEQNIGEVTQLYSHFRLEAEVYRVPVGRREEEGGIWVTPAEIGSYAISKADEKVLRLMEVAGVRRGRTRRQPQMKQDASP